LFGNKKQSLPQIGGASIAVEAAASMALVNLAQVSRTFEAHRLVYHSV